jgi:hypothetical protein
MSGRVQMQKSAVPYGKQIPFSIQANAISQNLLTSMSQGILQRTGLSLSICKIG